MITPFMTMCSILQPLITGISGFNCKNSPLCQLRCVQVSYGINYDSSKSHWKPPLNTRVFATGISDDTLTWHTVAMG